MSRPDMGVSAPAHEPEEAARMSAFERLIGTLLSPGETFQDINRKPNWLVPILLAIVFSLAGNLIIFKRIKPDWEKIAREQVEKSLESQGKTMSDLPEQQREAINNRIKMSSKISPIITIAGPFFLPIVMAILALLFWGVTTIMGEQTTYKKVFSLTAHAFSVVLIIVQTLLGVLVVFLRNPEDIDITKGIATTNPGMLMPQGTSPILTSLFTRLDILSIWFLVLMSIGLAAVCRKMKVGKAAAIVFGLWTLYIIGAVAFAAILR